MVDTRQTTAFIDFEVPDQARIMKVKNWLMRHGRLAPRDTAINLLEIGYSKGGLLDYLADMRHIRRFAIDINPRPPQPGIEFRQHDCNEGLPFLDDSRFDVVFAGEVIEHIYDDVRFLDEIYRILAPGGILALTTPNLFFLPSRLLFPFGCLPLFAYATVHYHFYSIPVLSKLVEKTGFTLVDIRSSHILISSRRNKLIGGLCERLGDIVPSLGAHILLFARKPN